MTMDKKTITKLARLFVTLEPFFETVTVFGIKLGCKHGIIDSKKQEEFSEKAVKALKSAKKRALELK